MAFNSTGASEIGSTDSRGVPVSYGDRSAIQALERAHECALAFRGDAIALTEAVLAEHPGFVMAHILKAAWLTQAMETRIYSEMVRAVESAEALIDGANDRERGHLEALNAWIHGDFFGAVQKWEAVLTHHPRDLLALQLVHLTDVLLGDVVGQRDVVARVFNLWDESVPGYEFVLGFYSFGLEENRDFFLAEEMGRQALALRPDNPYAVHSVAHVMEMQGRQAGGIRFMADHENRWGSSNFANHLWWHKALFHLDIGDVDGVLAIYDNHLRSDDPTGSKYEELDAAALLWRMKLLDIDTGERWKDLADKWEPSAQDTLYAFNDVHAMMTFVSDDRPEAQQQLLTANERYVESASDANVAMSREIGIPFCLAMQHFHKGRYGACVDQLLPVRYMSHRLGGSHAQRDILGWTLLEAALRARRFDLALGLANERCALKPTSMQNWIYVKRAFQGLGDRTNAERAEARALSLKAA
ncbi:MAG: tetratricopeptide repeat protein [Pseudomonadota bacterium]